MPITITGRWQPGVQVGGFQLQNATKHFLGLRIRTIGDPDVAIFHRERDRLAREIEGYSPQKVPLLCD